MSVRTMARVWAHSSHAGSELLILLAIADFADDDGNAYPAVSTLASKCRMSDRNANHILVALRASGELEIRHNEGPRGTNRYRIVLNDANGVKSASPPKHQKPLKPASPLGPEVAVTPEERVTLKPVAGGGEAGSSKPLKPASDEPSLNHQEPSRESSPRVVRNKAQKANNDVCLRDWLDAIQAKGEMAIPPDDSVFAYADQIGLPREFLHLAWGEFKARYTASPVKGEKPKSYTDWRAVFRNAVRQNWLKLWFLDGQQYTLTTVGQQAQRASAPKAVAA